MTDRTLATPADLEALAFDERGLVPVVAQDTRTGTVLMVAWADREALGRSLGTGELHFWSRSRQRLWRKGETSGNVLEVRSLHADCDGDTVLARVRPTGPACHTGETSCFGAGAAPGDADPEARSAGPGAGGPPGPDPHVLAELWDVIDARAAAPSERSYTARLLADENLRLKKLGEETAELVVALARGDAPRASEEAA
ncbi:MAG: phosphoribosyl-AMP cyclohydrolase, partial [Gemmatimonadota bacterium]